MENHIFNCSEKICTWISVQMMHQNATAPHNENINTFGTSQSTARLPAFFRICKKIPPIARVLQSCSWLKIHRMLRWSMFPSSFTHMICLSYVSANSGTPLTLEEFHAFVEQNNFWSLKSLQYREVGIASWRNWMDLGSHGTFNF